MPRTQRVRPKRPQGRWRYPYEPFPKQRQAHLAFADEVFFGGAAGGGKSEWLLADFVSWTLRFSGVNTILFRRTYAQLSTGTGLIQRLLSRIPPDIGTYNDTKHRWTFRNGSALEFGHLQYDKDIAKYMGPEYQRIGFDQLEQFTLWQLRMLQGRLRAAGPVRDALEAAGERPQMRATGNPGGVGHVFVKSRYIDPAPEQVIWQPEPTEDEKEPGTRVFIQSLHTDNPALDAGYRQRLHNLPEEERRALEEGDWDVFVGQRFKDFRRAIHVIDPEALPVRPGAGYPRAVGVDYGLDHPFAALWGVKLADGLIVVYREVGGAGFTPRQQAQKILAAEAPGERAPGRPIPVALDPSTWARQPNSPPPLHPSLPPAGSIADEYRQAGLPVQRANNNRLWGVGLIADKLRVRADGLPRILIYSTNRELVRTLPALVRDPARPEDVDTTGEDDYYDALRYLAGVLELAPAPIVGDQPGKDVAARRRDHVVSESEAGKLRKQGF